MRWFAAPPPTYPNVGDERIVRRFLWLPVTVGLETRWLEIAIVKERYTIVCGPADYPLDLFEWKVVEFV